METTAVQSLKLLVIQATGLSRDALHVYLGMLVFLLSAAILRKRIGSPAPWVAATVAACALEALDARDDMQLFGHWRIGASAHDIVNTMFWPTVLFLIARYSRMFHKGRGVA